MQHTQNYQLSRWEKDDRIMTEDFNADNAKLDAALSAKADAEDLTALAESVNAALGSGGHNCRIICGSYTGTGTYGAASPTSLTTGFAPVLVIVQDTEHVGYDPAILIRGMTVGRNNSGKSTLAVSWRDDGVSWYTTNTSANLPAAIQMNTADQTFYYAAIGYAAG